MSSIEKVRALRDWQCLECGKRLTLKAAHRAMFGADGCPKCGGSDIDLYVPETNPKGEAR